MTAKVKLLSIIIFTIIIIPGRLQISKPTFTLICILMIYNTDILQHSVTFLLKTFVPHLVSLTRSSLQVLNKTQTRVFPISGFLINALETKIVVTPELIMILT